MTNRPIEFTTQDIVASLGFEAQRIVAAVNHYAGGYPLPHPSELQAVIDRMAELNGALLAAAEPKVEAIAGGGMKVELT